MASVPPDRNRPSAERLNPIVDDEPVIAEVMQRLLIEEGLRSTVCGDGLQAYDVIMATRPSLLVLDLILPGRDGLDALAQIKGDPRSSMLPILICSAALDLMKRSARLFEAWGCGSLPKPFETMLSLPSCIRGML